VQLTVPDSFSTSYTWIITPNLEDRHAEAVNSNKYSHPLKISDFINLFHYFRCTLQGYYDFLVVDYVVVGEDAGFAVFQPFLGGLVFGIP
jgi:hypothetical protein